MSPAIDPTITEAPSQGSSGQAPASSASVDLGSFIASMGAVSGALTELLSVVNYNSSKISEFSSTMEQAQMKIYESEQQQAQSNLEQAMKETKNKGIFHKVFKAVAQTVNPTKGPAFVLAEAVDKAFPNSKIAHRVMTALLFVVEPYSELGRVLPHELQKVLPASVDRAFEKIHAGLEYVPNHAEKYLQEGEQHLVKYVAYPMYEALYHSLKLDPNMSDAEAQRIAHIAADAVATVLIMVALFVAVTVVTGGAADALLAEESAAVIGEEVGEALGELEANGFGTEIASVFDESEGATASEEITPAEEAAPEVVEAPAAQTPSQVNSKIDAQRFQNNIRQLSEAMQKMRYLQAIMNVIKGIEQLGNCYFDARMAITTKNMGQIQEGLKTSQSTLEQVSEINQLNIENLKEITQDCLSDITQLYRGLAGIMSSMSQAMYK